MVKLLSTAYTALSLLTVVLSTPTPQEWNGWEFYNQDQPCTPDKIKVRRDFDTLAPEERKAFTDAINCLISKPSQLDPSVYPAATNRFFDWAVLHVNRTRTVHLDGFFLPWHRLYLSAFEKDLEEQCGYTGTFPYWNWPATADNLEGSLIFDGSEYSMSGNGYFTNNDPYPLAPGFSIPHGSGGGCVISGPFANLITTMPPVSIDYLINGTDIPHSVYDRVDSCLTRDLNTYAAQTWTNYTAVQVAVESPDLASFSQVINGVLGGTSLGIHSGAHFVVGPPASNIFVSAQDPIWYPLHTMLDRTYVSWQARHPDQAEDVFGTETAVNKPPSPNVTIDTIVPDLNYFDTNVYTVGELLSTTAGPFCYVYDTNI